MPRFHWTSHPGDKVNPKNENSQFGELCLTRASATTYPKNLRLPCPSVLMHPNIFGTFEKTMQSTRVCMLHKFNVLMLICRTATC